MYVPGLQRLRRHRLPHYRQPPGAAHRHPDLVAGALQRENAGAVQSLTRMEQRVQELSTLLKKLYEDYTFSRISAAMYEKLSADYESELSSLEQSIKQLRQRLEPDTSCSDSYREFFALLDEMEGLPALTRPILRKFIDRIKVEQGEYIRDENGKRRKIQKIRIFYRFIGPIDIE